MSHVAKFESVGDWEVLYVNGESVKQNHIGRIDVLSYLEGHTVDTVETGRVNLPEGDNRFPKTLEEVIEDKRYDYEGEKYNNE